MYFTLKYHKLKSKNTFHPLSPPSLTLKTISQHPKHEFQNEIPYSDTMKVKFQVEMSFLYRKEVISQKNIIFSHKTKVCTRTDKLFINP